MARRSDRRRRPEWRRWQRREVDWWEALRGAAHGASIARTSRLATERHLAPALTSQLHARRIPLAIRACAAGVGCAIGRPVTPRRAAGAKGARRALAERACRIHTSSPTQYSSMRVSFSASSQYRHKSLVSRLGSSRAFSRAHMRVRREQCWWNLSALKGLLCWERAQLCTSLAEPVHHDSHVECARSKRSLGVHCWRVVGAQLAHPLHLQN